MKIWHIAALLAALGIVYVLVKRPTVVPVSTSPYASNDWLSMLGSLAKTGASLVGKIGMPTQTPDVGGNEGTYNTGGSQVIGNTLQSSNGGGTLTYGTD